MPSLLLDPLPSRERDSGLELTMELRLDYLFFSNCDSINARARSRKLALCLDQMLTKK